MEPRRKVVEQARLADARVTDERDQPQPPGGHRGPERVAEEAHLRVAADHRTGVGRVRGTLAAQAADLSKSYLKRLRGVKDTGAIFPGHGGVLDRFDAMIGASPVVVIFLVLVGLL